MTLQTPDELSLLEIFGAEPIDRKPDDGFWRYIYTDSYNLTLQFSLNIFEASIQTIISDKNRVIQLSSYEGATRLLDARDYRLSDGRQMALRGEFEYKNAQGILEVFLVPQISVNWNLLITK
jgi:hypothetical protein